MTAKETLTDVYRKYRAFMLEYDKAVQIKQADNAKRRGG